MNPGEPTRPMCIWVTGSPVPEVARKHGSFADMIKATVGDAWTGPWSEVDCEEDGVALPDENDVAGIIITGSPARIADQSPWMLRSQDRLRSLVESGVPVFGICFGHQLLGVTLGGRSGPNPLGREIGTVKLSTHRPDTLFGKSLRSFPVSMTHLDCVLELPRGAECLASTDLDRYAAIRFAERTWGVQFHPEMDREIISGYIAAFRDRLPAEGFDPDALLAACRDTPESAKLLRSFALQARASSNADSLADSLQYRRQQGVRT